MRRFTVAVACLVVAGLPRVAVAQGEEADQAQQMMAMMEKLAKPGPNHELLTSMAGQWKTETRAWTGPGEPTVTRGSATLTPILGGRFVQERFEGTFMDKPFEGFGLTGFDNASQQFISTWCDTLGTTIYLSRGTYDEAARTMRMSMEMDNPMTGERETVRVENHFVSDDRHVFSMFENREGREVKTMEITYTRK